MPRLTMGQVASADWKDTQGLLESLKNVLATQGVVLSVLDRGDDNWWVAVGAEVYTDEDLAAAIHEDLLDEERPEEDTNG